MSTLRARVDSEIVLRVADLDQRLHEQIRSALTWANEEKRKQLALKLYGAWDLPDTISMWREEERRGEGRVLCLPRGFAVQLVMLASSHGLQIEWDDRRSVASAALGYFRPFLLRDYQMQAVTSMLSAEQGVYSCPAGGGKTVSMLNLFALAQQRAVVIVDKAFLLEQWRERAAQFLGLSLDLKDERSVGKIGEDVWVERDLTICLRQTLFSRLWETKATNWWQKVGIVVLDECHHLSGESLQEIVRNVPSKMIFGVSATPARTPDQAKVVAALVGPIVAQTTRQELYDRGVLVRPRLRNVQTELDADFWPTHDSSSDGTCQVPNCKKNYPHGHRDNYQSVLKRLVEDEDRNALIASRIVKDRGHVHLVSSRQLKHLDLIKKALLESGWDGPVYMLRGEENARGDSQEIVKAIEAGGIWELDTAAMKAHKKETKESKRIWKQTRAPIEGEPHEAVILSTVADEGMDIPMIDRLHGVFPLKQEAALIQLIGRGERVAANKKDYVFINYHDMRVSVFNDHHADRMNTFRYQGLEVEREEIKT